MRMRAFNSFAIWAATAGDQPNYRLLILTQFQPFTRTQTRRVHGILRHCHCDFPQAQVFDFLGMSTTCTGRGSHSIHHVIRSTTICFLCTLAWPNMCERHVRARVECVALAFERRAYAFDHRAHGADICVPAAWLRACLSSGRYSSARCVT